VVALGPHWDHPWALGHHQVLGSGFLEGKVVLQAFADWVLEILSQGCQEFWGQVGGCDHLDWAQGTFAALKEARRWGSFFLLPEGFEDSGRGSSCLLSYFLGSAGCGAPADLLGRWQMG